MSSSNDFKTPQNSQQNPESFSTPKNNGVNRRLEAIKAGAFSSTPLKVPASPMMERLGYGTGVGVYILERSPKPTGEARSPWAIKKIASLRDENGKLRDDSCYARRLEHEAKILKTLSHPNIIGYRAFSAISGSNKSSYLAMEKASKSLADLIESRYDDLVAERNDDFQAEMTNPYPAHNIERVILDIAKALDYLHTEKRMAHCDLKSGNILIFNEFEAAKLCDFGVTRKLKANGLIDGTYVGTEIWNPMEVHLSKMDKKKWDITHKADMYPLGLVIYEMIALTPPHFPPETDMEKSYTGESEAPSFDEKEFDRLLSENIGTRPMLPDIEFEESYNKAMQVFYILTEEDPSLRPDAKDVVALLETEPEGEKN